MTVPTVTDLYCPPDVDEAHALFKLNCGPCALAALVGRPVLELRDLFPQYPARPWSNPSGMRAALALLGVGYRVVSTPADLVAGLNFIQFKGPWLDPGVPVGAAYKRTHWIAAGPGRLVYDVNAGEWLSRAEWVADVVPHLLAATTGATGWCVRTGIEVRS